LCPITLRGLKRRSTEQIELVVPHGIANPVCCDGSNYQQSAKSADTACRSSIPDGAEEVWL